MQVFRIKKNLLHVIGFSIKCHLLIKEGLTIINAMVTISFGIKVAVWRRTLIKESMKGKDYER